MKDIDSKNIWNTLVTEAAAGKTGDRLAQVKSALGQVAPKEYEQLVKAMFVDEDFGTALGNILYNSLGVSEEKLGPFVQQIMRGQSQAADGQGTGNSGVQYAPEDGTDPHTLPDSKGEVRGPDGRFGAGNKSGVQYN